MFTELKTTMISKWAVLSNERLSNSIC